MHPFSVTTSIITLLVPLLLFLPSFPSLLPFLSFLLLLPSFVSFPLPSSSSLPSLFPPSKFLHPSLLPSPAIIPFHSPSLPPPLHYPFLPPPLLTLLLLPTSSVTHPPDLPFLLPQKSRTLPANGFQTSNYDVSTQQTAITIISQFSKILSRHPKR